MARLEGEFVCPECNEYFLSRKKNAKYCSRECLYESMRVKKIDKNCQQCGKNFDVYKGRKESAKYCSRDCSNKAKGKLNTNINCDNCGKEFYRKQSHIDRNVNNFCDIRCRGEYKTKSKIREIEEDKGIDLKDYLYKEYITNKNTTREISESLYGHRQNYNNISKYLKYYDIPIRYGSEAIKPQWEGTKGKERKKLSSQIAKTYLNSEESRNVLRNIMQTDEYRKKCSEAKLGKLNPMYNSNITDEERKEMYKDKRDDGYSYWRRKVYERDNYTCQITGIKSSGNIVAHHLDGYNWCVHKRFDINNGITLLDEIHKEFHRLYGYGNNTKEQFEEFKEALSDKDSAYFIA